jgi:hypothetical protein
MQTDPAAMDVEGAAAATSSLSIKTEDSIKKPSAVVSVSGRSAALMAVIKESVDAKDKYGFSPLMCAASLESDDFGDAPTILCR